MDSLLNILVVEDHDDLRDATVAALSDMGHHAQGVDCAEAMDQALARHPADIVLLDLNLPGENGLSIARRLRAAEPTLGIIMITARNRASDVTAGYENGADIYVTKPVSQDALNAAIKALARRVKPAASSGHKISLDLIALRLIGPADTIDLSHNESLLLAALAHAQDQRMETWQLLELLNKQADDLEKRALTVQIVRLRKKLEQVGAPEPTIKSIRGSGYQLCVALKIESSPQ